MEMPSIRNHSVASYTITTRPVILVDNLASDNK